MLGRGWNGCHASSAVISPAIPTLRAAVEHGEAHHRVLGLTEGGHLGRVCLAATLLVEVHATVHQHQLAPHVLGGGEHHDRALAGSQTQAIERLRRREEAFVGGDEGEGHALEPHVEVACVRGVDPPQHHRVSCLDGDVAILSPIREQDVPPTAP